MFCQESPLNLHSTPFINRFCCRRYVLFWKITHLFRQITVTKWSPLYSQGTFKFDFPCFFACFQSLCSRNIYLTMEWKLLMICFILKRHKSQSQNGPNYNYFEYTCLFVQEIVSIAVGALLLKTNWLLWKLRSVPLKLFTRNF